MIGDKITDLSQLRNDMCYTILPQDNSRGTWVFNPDDPVRLYSTEKMGIEVNQSDPAQWFAFLKSKSGKYYVYNVQSDKFLCYGDGEVSLKADYWIPLALRLLFLQQVPTGKIILG